MKTGSLLLLLTFSFVVTERPLLSAKETKDSVSVTIVVMGPRGGMVPDAQIKLSPSPAKAPKNPETNEHGEFSLDLVPGSYDLFVSFPVFVPWAKQIQVLAAPSQTVRVVLEVAETTAMVQTCSPCPPVQLDSVPQPPAVPSASASLTIVVKDATGAVVPYAQIGGYLQAGTWRVPEADEHGRFSIKVIPGSLNLAVTSPGFRRWTKRIRLQDGESQTVDVLLNADDAPPPG
jgi:hypothetical protein